jgi:hypothetical protein
VHFFYKQNITKRNIEFNSIGSIFPVQLCAARRRNKQKCVQDENNDLIYIEPIKDASDQLIERSLRGASLLAEVLDASFLAESETEINARAPISSVMEETFWSHLWLLGAILSTLLFVLGVIGNSLTIIILAKNKSLRCPSARLISRQGVQNYNYLACSFYDFQSFHDQSDRLSRAGAGDDF